jgi:hypothetical protein
MAIWCGWDAGRRKHFVVGRPFAGAAGASFGSAENIVKRAAPASLSMMRKPAGARVLAGVSASKRLNHAQCGDATKSIERAALTSDAPDQEMPTDKRKCKNTNRQYGDVIG